MTSELPLAEGGPPIAGIEREKAIMRPLQTRADVLIDTSDLNIHEFRAEMERWFAPGGQHHLNVSVQSFSYKRGTPRSADMVLDCRFLRNPHWDADLRASDGRDPAVVSYILQDEADEVKRMVCQAFTTNLDKLLLKTRFVWINDLFP